MKNPVLKQIVQECNVFLLDMDGTINIGDYPIGDMQNTLQKLRTAGKIIVYLTNNSSRAEEEIRDKLVSLGFWSDKDFIYSSGLATLAYLKEFYGDKRVHLFATDSVKNEFIRSGIVLDEESPEVCVLTYDTTATFDKISRFHRSLEKDTLYIASHPDLVCPSDKGFQPDLGSFIRLFEGSSNRLPERICGKPYPIMGEYVKKFFNISPERILMVGDRLSTDIRFGVNCGFHTLLVFSGDATPESYELSSDRADAALLDLNAITEYL